MVAYILIRDYYSFGSFVFKLAYKASLRNLYLKILTRKKCFLNLQAKRFFLGSKNLLCLIANSISLGQNFIQLNSSSNSATF